MPSFWLEYEQNGSVEEYTFDGATVSIGREKGSDFVLDHPTVSRQHAVISRSGSGFHLVVLSRGGMTAVDGQQVQGEVDLHDRAVLHFGQFQFTFRSDEAPAKPASQQGAGLASQSQPSWPNQGQMASPAVAPQPAQFGAGNQQAWGQTAGVGGQPGGGSPDPWGAQPAAGQQAGGWGGEVGAESSQPQGGPWGASNFGGGGQPQDGGWGPQGFGPEPGSSGAEPSSASEDEEGHGIVSWDEIADSPEARGEAAGGDGQTNYDRIQAAQQKANKQSQGSNPVILIGGGIGIALMMLFILFPSGPAELVGQQQKGKSFDELPYYEWSKTEVDCIGKADCTQQALRAYQVGKENLDKKDVNIANLFMGWRNLERVDRLLEKENLQRPPEMADLEQRKVAARAELDALFRNLRVKFHKAKKRKMYMDMAGALNELTAYFPKKHAREHQWALTRMREMKDQGTYPQKLR